MRDVNFLLLMYGLTSEQRLEAYHQYNSWKWPDILAAYKPEGFDEKINYNPRNKNDSTVKTSTKEYVNLGNALHITTSEWERSWSHNKKSLTPQDAGSPHMTPEQHCEWFQGIYKK